MLVLTRKVGEEICIGSEIKAKILTVQSGRVRIGLSGPPEVTFLRGELRPREAKRQMAKSPKAALSAVA